MEDHSVVREVISRLLETFGAKVTPVPGVPVALEALGRERPNVVLASIARPGMSGLFGSHGANTGARMATTTSTPTTTAPTQASWLRRNVRQN